MDNLNIIEIIEGVPVDWSKFELGSKRSLQRRRNAYIKLCKSLHERNHTLLSEYKNSDTKVLIDFNCGHIPNEILPYHYNKGIGCPRCAGKLGQAKEDFINEVKNNGHTLLSEYKNERTKVLIDFNCGHKPHSILPSGYKSGRRCPACSGHCSEQAKEDFINMVEENGHTLLSKYVDATTKVLLEFNCGHEPNWITPNNYKRGAGCPYCCNKGEAALHKLLLDMGYEVKTQYKYKDLKDKYCLKYDFYLPEYNLLIELDGEHHREEIIYKSKNNTTNQDEIEAAIRFQDRQHKDKLKDDYAKANNIPLLRIRYDNGKIELDKWRELILNKLDLL